MRRLLIAFVCLCFPARIKPALLAILGCRVHRSARIGPSIVLTDCLAMGPDTRIGPFNLLRVRRLVMRREAYVGYGNAVRGPVSVRLGPRSSIGNRNVVIRAGHAAAFGPANLWLGELSKITAGHYVDTTETIRFGDFTTLAGVGSQLWTHGFVHAGHGEGRAQVLGGLRFGDNVYIGSACVVSPGVTIADQVMVGSHASIARDLDTPGFYVPPPLRALERVMPEDLTRLENIALNQRVPTYRKRRRSPDSHAA
jgi:acetyltransferase-like isoleucine patch superfamily enzyme